MATVTSKMNSAYWRKRTVRQAEQQMQADEKLNQDIAREYERILHELDQELSSFYARYAQNKSISMAEARRLLKDAELEDFRMSLDEFRAKAVAGGYDKELNEIYLRTRVSRLQALQTQIRLRIQELFQEQQEQLHDHLAGIYTDTYYQTVYAVSQQTPVLASFARIDTETVEKLLSKSWLDSDFSSRIWVDRDKLLRELETALSRSFVRGEPLQRVSKHFAERMGVSQSRAATLIHTESAHAAAEATARGYQETGVSAYTFDASLDLKTCPICGAMDGMTFKVSERETGVNYPPVHPRCRCTTVPETEVKISGKRAARNPQTGKTEYVDQDMTYSEWHKKYVEGDTVDKSTKSAIMETKTGENGETVVHDLGRLDKEKYQRIAKDIATDEVIITDERIDHIRQRHPNDYERFQSYLPRIIADPDYIIADDRPNTALVLKEVEEAGERFRLSLRLVTHSDNPDYKNSVITFLKIREKEWNRLIRNKTILYKKE